MVEKDETAGKTEVKPGSQDGKPENRTRIVDSSAKRREKRGNDAIATGRTDCKRRNLAELDPRDAAKILGKILSQLRKIEKAHLAYVEAHEGRLETRLKESRKHKEQIIHDIEELETEIKSLLNDDDEELNDYDEE